jgi:hypothetical protein
MSLPEIPTNGPSIITATLQLNSGSVIDLQSGTLLYTITTTGVFVRTYHVYKANSMIPISSPIIHSIALRERLVNVNGMTITFKFVNPLVSKDIQAFSSLRPGIPLAVFSPRGSLKGMTNGTIMINCPSEGPECLIREGIPTELFDIILTAFVEIRKERMRKAAVSAS